MGSQADTLTEVLKSRFGHPEFRPYQESVCRAVVEGHDTLLVMPTGSGKSLCYQLPGIAMNGTTLVISPLIALMEDQTMRLQALGFRAERIHSGRTREQSRAACRAYLDGELDFLTIAPERLSVPGFPEMLAKRKPKLIAVDEAHCISHWGHDFRPDYRLLAQRIPLLRPAVILALTATATQRVQNDILTQLGAPQAKRFIHGFRRHNLALESVECPPSRRFDLLTGLLESEERLPALVYVPSRKLAEEISDKLDTEGHRTAAYHAGMPASARNKTQEKFLSSELDIVVATIAFGMGIDKRDIRTVVHLGLPSSLEGYYQEIGRAGRDGELSRAFLLYDFADRRIHETFLERDYPEVRDLEHLLRAVPASGISREELWSKITLSIEVAEPALDKLWIHGGVTIDHSDVVHKGHDRWKGTYQTIRQHRVDQMEEVLGYAQSSDCRMTRLVRHFGDVRDSKPCGHCDGCAPTGALSRSFRPAGYQERTWAAELLEELDRFDNQSTGRLYRALHPNEEVPRRQFEEFLGALARAGAIAITTDEFTKDGELIRFQRAQLLPGGSKIIRDGQFVVEQPRLKAKKKEAVGKRTTKTAGTPLSADASERFQKLRAWRLELARAQSVPAFRIMSDRVMHSIAERDPQDLDELETVPGVGKKLVEKHGRRLLAVLT